MRLFAILLEMKKMDVDESSTSSLLLVHGKWTEMLSIFAKLKATK